MDKPLKKIDHMMWDVDVPTSYVTITGMMCFEEQLDKKQLSKIIETRLLKFERFHKKVILKNKKPHWHVDEAFDLRAHIHHIALPAPSDYNTLQEVISDLISQPLDHSIPLWQVHLIDNFNGGSVVVWRLHHAIADGIALIKVVFSLTNDTKEASLQTAVAEQKILKKKHTLMEDIGELLNTGKDIYAEAQHLLREPAAMKDALKESWSISKEIGRLFFGESVQETIYKGKLSYSKKAAWSKPLPLNVIKRIGKHYKATVNDILLALITGALRRHLIKHKQPLDKCIRVVVPVNIRKKDEEIKVHNKIGMLSIELPVHIKNTEERIEYIREKTELLKHSIEPVLIYNLLNILADVIPAALEQKFSDFIGTKIAGVVTNVPGPFQPIYLAGAKVKDMMFWVPQTSPLGIGVSIISYNNRVCLGIVTDTSLVDDPDEIVSGYYKEFEAMQKRLK
jgi:diacylglycerol O-acyltransferase / wax synthase